jgi:xylono-1,5-lactonase
MEKIVTGYGLLEGPTWSSNGTLLFADADSGGVFNLNVRTGSIDTVDEHRRGIGGLAEHQDGGIVVSGRNVAYKAAGRPTSVLIDNDIPGGRVGFNDLTTDAAGRVFVGSLGFYPTVPGDEPRAGNLYVIDLDGSHHVAFAGVQLTNGMGFSPDGRQLYHCDSGDQTVYVYDADGASLSDRRPFASVETGLPDGLAVSEDGAVWVAVAHAGEVRVFESDGSLRTVLGLPLPMVTSVCFGGDDLCDLFVVTGSDGAEGKVGSVFHERVAVPGVAVASARIPVPES